MTARTHTEASVTERPRLVLPGVVLGVGLGGFVDGILLHQILQWHHMLTSTDSDNVGCATTRPTRCTV